MASLQSGSTAGGNPITAWPTGTAVLFNQTSAPTGWTKITSYGDHACRVVSGTVGSGGSVAFSTAWTNKTVSGTVTGSVQSTTLSTSQIPSHVHFYSGAPTDDNNWSGTGGNGQTYGLMSDAPPYVSNDPNYGYGRYMQATGSGSAHDHGAVGTSFNGNAFNINVTYVDVIIATRS
jgi:hypothetical protein